MKLNRRQALRLFAGTASAATMQGKWNRALAQSPAEERSIAPGKSAGTQTLTAQAYAPNWESLDKRPMPSWFTDAKFGIIIHWGVYSVPAYAPIVPGELGYAEWYWHQMIEGRDNPKASKIETGTWDYHLKVYGRHYDYQNFAPQFRAQLFDPDQWANILADSGAKYVMLTSKHHEGYTLWPSKEASATWGRPWNSSEIGPMRDLAADLGDAVRGKGVRMGYYYSLYEWYNPLWLTDKPRYVREHMMPQFKDMVMRLKPSIIFSDGEWDLSSAEWRSPELLAWLFNKSAVKDEVVINDRWGKETRHLHGGYWTTEYTAGMSGIDHPWEENRGMAFSYGYNRAEDLQDYLSGRELVLMLVDIVSRGGNLLLDIGPDADGLIPVIMQDRLQQIGSWLAINGEAIYGTRPWKTSRQWGQGEIPTVEYNESYHSQYDVSQLVTPKPGQAAIEAFFTAKQNNLYAILPHWPGHTFVLKGASGIKSAVLLGDSAPLKYAAGPTGATFDLPPLPDKLLSQPSWVIKVTS